MALGQPWAMTAHECKLEGTLFTISYQYFLLLCSTEARDTDAQTQHSSQNQTHTMCCLTLSKHYSLVHVYDSELRRCNLV